MSAKCYDWIQRYFSDEEAVVLAVLLFLAFTAVLTLGGMLAPVLAGDGARLPDAGPGQHP